MKKEHAVWLLCTIVASAAVSTALGKLDAKQFIEAVALVLAYLAPSPVFADISKGDK
jgi:hypothetical protein